MHKKILTKDFLIIRPQAVRLAPPPLPHYHSAPARLPARLCTKTPTVFPVHIWLCPNILTNVIIKYAVDTTVVRLVSKRDEMVYRIEEEVNNLKLNFLKRKWLILDFREHRHDHTLFLINGECMETVSTFKFLCHTCLLISPGPTTSMSWWRRPNSECRGRSTWTRSCCGFILCKCYVEVDWYSFIFFIFLKPVLIFLKMAIILTGPPQILSLYSLFMSQ